MVRVERACIDFMMALKNGDKSEQDLEGFKENIFRMSMEAMYGEKVWDNIEKYLTKLKK